MSAFVMPNSLADDRRNAKLDLAFTVPTADMQVVALAAAMARKDDSAGTSWSKRGYTRQIPIATT
jgi:hypothetical protein